MTLLSDIQVLRARADVANDEHSVKVRTGEFAELSARLAPLLTELPELNVGLAEIAQLPIALPTDHDENARQLDQDLRALATELPALGIADDLDLAKGRVRAAEKHVQELRALVASVWRLHVSQPPPAVNDDLVDALARGGIDVEEIRSELETAQSRLLLVASRPIPDRGAVQKYRDAIDSIRRCGESIGQFVDADIADGIVGSQQASGVPLTWFTPGRIEKLGALGILDRFQVRLR